MRILAACSIGGAGHLQPLVPFLDAARQCGDDVLVVGPPALKDMVRAAGHRFHPGAEPAEDEVAPIRELLPVLPPHEASVLGNRELFGRLATRCMLPAMERVWADFDPDLIVREPCEYASAIVASRHAVPVAQVAISLSHGEAASIAVAAPALEEYGAEVVPSLWDMPYLTRFPESLDPSAFATTRRYREPTLPPGPGLPDWWSGADGPLVYVTFGTVLGYMSMAGNVFRTALNALDGLAARVLLSVGREFDPSELGSLPRNAHVERWVPQHQVMGEADLVLCHGGSGTTLGALAAGVPLVVLPLFADQFENGRRVAGVGAARLVALEGVTPHGPRRPLSAHDVPLLRDHIDVALTERSYRDHARLVAAEMAAMASCRDALGDVLERPT